MWFVKKKEYDFYLAGPMRGYPELNKGMFTRIAKGLRDMGLTVWSPSEHESYLKLSFAQCMTVDLNKVINDCRKIAFLPGWRASLGANMEAFAAFSCKKEALEVIIGDTTSMDLVPLDLSNYLMPYQIGQDRRKFDPHSCPVETLNTDDD
jgi:hypothetical protein